MSELFSNECLKVLQALAERRNVLVSGPPAVGKSYLLNEVARAFTAKFSQSNPTTIPRLEPAKAVPIPPEKVMESIDPELLSVLPSPIRSYRRVFRTVFHQNSKYRDFLTGLVPSLDKAGAFNISEGVLYRANEHALTGDGASLLIIDEINRGPAVQVFGGSIVAIESEKRLDCNGIYHEHTQSFELLDPQTNTMVEHAFSHHLYILGAMNQADVSVEPLDVAFLRRWTPFNLGPDESVLRNHFGLTAQPREVTKSPSNAKDVYEATVQAWAKINKRISLGRGHQFQIGHGIVMNPSGVAPDELEGALALAARGWNSIRAHLDEIFFGDIRGLAAAMNAFGQLAEHPYRLQEIFFADEPKQELKGPISISPSEVYAVLIAVAERNGG